ncbi:MAG TPA: cytosine permease [Candidatus Limnocylindrales bacterium]|nr:cytosine permease [Candidatus Limnocylindrales bacterium]
MTAISSTRDTMPRGQGDLTIEGRGIEPIPEEARYGAVSRVFTVWFTPNLVPAAFAVGTIATADFVGLGWWSGLAAILLGTAIAAALVGLLSAMGPTTGMAQMAASRMPFGKSVVVPGLINWLSTIAWDAINAFFGAWALEVLIGLPFVAGLAVVIVCQAILSIVGYEAIHTFERYAAVVLFILFAVVTVAALPKMDFGLADQDAASAGTFILMSTISGSFVLAWALYASDYSRYLPRSASRPRIWLWTFLGLFLSAGWLEALGLAVTSALGSSQDATHQINDVMGGGALGALAMIAIFFGTVAVNAMNDYTGSLSLLAAGLRIWRPLSALVVGVLSFLATLYLYAADFQSTFENYLLVLSYWVGPWMAIVLADWWLRRGSFDGQRAVSFRALPSGLTALIALVVGFVVSIPFMNQSLYQGPASVALDGADVAYVVGFIVAGLLFLILERLAGSTAVARD